MVCFAVSPRPCASSRLRSPAGGAAAAWALGKDSAEVHRRLLETLRDLTVRAGVDVTQLEPIGHGAAQPVAPNDNSENMARNRRIEFTVRPK